MSSNAYADALGREPEQVAQPTTAEEVAEVVRWAGAAGKAVIPWGGGTGQAYGHIPRRGDVLLDLSRLNRIVAHEPGDMTVTVEAGANLAQVQKALGKHNQCLPLDPPQAEAATLGGILATNAFGPSCLGHGTIRDWLIGIRVVDAQGRSVKGGGKVVKNVTGYDLPKMHVGALGTLGVIVEATFTVAPKPEAVRTVVVRRGGGAGDVAAFIEAVRQATDPVRLFLHDDATGAYAILGFEGMGEVVEDAVSRVRAAAGEADLTSVSVFDGEIGAEDPPAALSLRVGLHPAGPAAQHEAAVALVRPSEGNSQVRTLAGADVTDVHWKTDDAAGRAVLAQVLTAAHALGCKTQLLHGPVDLRTAESIVGHPLPSSLPQMRRLKESLDPGAVLNPGRFVGGL
jgi:glycolate oxidase FAD binding subunit